MALLNDGVSGNLKYIFPAFRILTATLMISNAR